MGSESATASRSPEGPAQARRWRRGAFTVAVVSGLAFGLLAWRLRRPGLVWGERSVAQALSERDGGMIGAAAAVLDEGLNDWGASIVFVVLLIAVRVRWGTIPGVVFLMAGLSTTLLKVIDVVERPRPTPALSWGRYLPGYGGFPSGHVVYVVVLCATLAGLGSRYEPVRTLRWAIWVPTGGLVVAVGPARIVTNDHWAADVVGGYLLATFLLSIGFLLSARVTSEAALPVEDAHPVAQRSTRSVGLNQHRVAQE